jgi:hypothetical protein
MAITLDHFPLHWNKSSKGHNLSSSSGGTTGGGNASSDWDDTEDTDTASIETDPDTDGGGSHATDDTNHSLEVGVAALSSDDTGFGFGDSTLGSLQPQNFVSLSNILQLQSDSIARPKSGKSRSGSASARRNNASAGKQ